MAQNTQATQTNSPKPDDAPKSNEAIQDIEAPFQLGPDNIVQRAEGETGQLVYDVFEFPIRVGEEAAQGGKVLFSTLSAPLAHAFVQGYNAKPTSAKGGNKKDDDRTVDPKEQDKSSSKRSPANDGKSAPTKTGDAAGKKSENAGADNKPAPKHETREADTAPRKRGVL